MAKPTGKAPVKVTVRITPGPTTMAMRAQWRRVWARLIHEATEKTPASADDTTGAIKEDMVRCEMDRRHLSNSMSKVAADDITAELPDCPVCGRWEWTYSPDGELLCPCGYKGVQQ